MNLEEEYDKWGENIGKWRKINVLFILVGYSVLICGIILFPTIWFHIGIGVMFPLVVYIAFRQYWFNQGLKLIIEEAIEEKEE